MASSLRKIIKTRGHFLSNDALVKLANGRRLPVPAVGRDELDHRSLLNVDGGVVFSP
jgi:hypothetical protein